MTYALAALLIVVTIIGARAWLAAWRAAGEELERIEREEALLIAGSTSSLSSTVPSSPTDRQVDTLAFLMAESGHPIQLPRATSAPLESFLDVAPMSVAAEGSQPHKRRTYAPGLDAAISTVEFDCQSLARRDALDESVWEDDQPTRVFSLSAGPTSQTLVTRRGFFPTEPPR